MHGTGPLCAQTTRPRRSAHHAAAACLSASVTGSASSRRGSARAGLQLYSAGRHAPVLRAAQLGEGRHERQRLRRRLHVEIRVLKRVLCRGALRWVIPAARGNAAARCSHCTAGDNCARARRRQATGRNDMRCGSTELWCAAGIPAVLGATYYARVRRYSTLRMRYGLAGTCSREQLMQQIERLAANAFGQAVLEVVVRLERNAHVLGAR